MNIVNQKCICGQFMICDTDSHCCLKKPQTSITSASTPLTGGTKEEDSFTAQILQNKVPSSAKHYKSSAPKQDILTHGISEIIKKHCSYMDGFIYTISSTEIISAANEIASQSKPNPSPDPSQAQPVTEEEREWYENVLKALQELVLLKSIKDIPAYALDYEQRKPIAWANAKRFSVRPSRLPKQQEEIEALRKENRELKEHLSDMKGFFVDGNSPL